jgi:hypothetical protein
MIPRCVTEAITVDLAPKGLWFSFGSFVYSTPRSSLEGGGPIGRSRTVPPLRYRDWMDD